MKDCWQINDVKIPSVLSAFAEGSCYCMALSAGEHFTWGVINLLKQLTVVSVASQPPNSPQKAVGVPLNVALGQQILTVQHSTPTSPGKAVTNNTAAQVCSPYSPSGCCYFLLPLSSHAQHQTLTISDTVLNNILFVFRWAQMEGCEEKKSKANNKYWLIASK